MITEIINETTESEHKNRYTVGIKCLNCGVIQIHDILHGMTVSEFVKSQEIKCGYCLCPKTCMVTDLERK